MGLLEVCVCVVTRRSWCAKFIEKSFWVDIVLSGLQDKTQLNKVKLSGKLSCPLITTIITSSRDNNKTDSLKNKNVALNFKLRGEKS